MNSSIQPKHILIFSLAYVPHNVSGAEIAIKEVTDRIDPSTIAFSMVTLRYPGSLARERVGNIEVYRVGFGGVYLSKILFVPLAAWKARSLYRAGSVDALWSVMTYMLFPVVLAQLIGVHAPYIVTLQDGDPYEKVFMRWRIVPFVPLLDWGFRHAARVHTISAYLATWPRKRGYRGEVEVIPNGADSTDVEESTINSDILERLKEKIGLHEGDIVLVNTARLEYQKAFDVVIRALPLLPSQVKFLIVGRGTEEKKLRALADELGVSHRVVFVGQVAPEEATMYRRIANIFVMPSRSEGLGIAGLSAMASRIPVIATREGGLAEFVCNDARPHAVYGATAWVVEKDSPEAIARAVADILAHPDRAREVVARARRMIEEIYQWDSIAKDMEKRMFKPVTEN